MSTIASHEVVNELFVGSNHHMGEMLGDLSNHNLMQNKVGAAENSYKTYSGAFRLGLPSKSFDGSAQSLEIITEALTPKGQVPNMWTKEFIGLYCQYAAVGLLYGSSGTLLPFCVYNYHGASNVCANAKNIVFFAWSFKIVFAVLTDSFQPFGLRRKPWMLLGWAIVLLILLILAIAADTMSVSVWLTSLLFVQCFLMLSDVPADGYCVELGQLESKEQRGQILATGQRIRFTFCIVAGLVQTCLLNGPSTNAPGCAIAFESCWSWGLTVNGYYALLFVMVMALTFPILWLKEVGQGEEGEGAEARHHRHSFNEYLQGIWLTLQNLTTFSLLVFVIGIQSLTNFTNNATIFLQYYVIQLTNFQAGIDTITTYSALVASIYLFQRYLIHRNWRLTQYYSTLVAALLGLVWIAPFYNAGGKMNAWFTIFIDLDTNFAQGLSQVLYSMAVIELARAGQEATTYELIVTVGNAALTLNGIISTQLLTPLNAVGCTNSDDDASSSSPSCASATTVDVSSPAAFRASDGPARFTNYTLVLTGISIGACLLFTRFLPASKEECHLWRLRGEQEGGGGEGGGGGALGERTRRGKVAVVMSLIVVGYGLIAAILLLDVDTACQPAIGGSGC